MAEAATQENQQNFTIQRIYLKDLSFEAPNAPAVFQKEWAPEIQLDIGSSKTTLGDNVHEVVLRLTVTVKIGEEVAYLCEAQQAGIFTAENMDEGQLAHCLGAFCPNILFPYAREVISNQVVKASFPALNLNPVNFEALFMNHLQSQVQAAQATPEAE